MDFSSPTPLVTFEQEALYEQNRILQVLDLQGLEVSAVCFWMERVHVSPPWRNQKASEAYLLCLGFFRDLLLKIEKKSGVTNIQSACMFLDSVSMDLMVN